VGPEPGPVVERLFPAFSASHYRLCFHVGCRKQGTVLCFFWSTFFSRLGPEMNCSFPLSPDRVQLTLRVSRADRQIRIFTEIVSCPMVVYGLQEMVLSFRISSSPME